MIIKDAKNSTASFFDQIENVLVLSELNKGPFDTLPFVLSLRLPSCFSAIFSSQPLCLEPRWPTTDRKLRPHSYEVSSFVSCSVILPRRLLRCLALFPIFVATTLVTPKSLEGQADL